MREGKATIHSSSIKPKKDAAISTAAAPNCYESHPSDEREHAGGDISNEINTSNSTSSMKSEFRQSLEDEVLEKDRRRKMKDMRLQQSKKNLRQSITAKSESLTHHELNFLESLLELSGPRAAEACNIAHERLMDTDLFLAVCAGSAGEVRIPGHEWTAKSANHDGSEQPQELDGSEEWVSKGTPPNPTERKVLSESEKTQNDRPASDMSQATEQFTRPYALQRHSSLARLARLESRKWQSSSGGDTNRLYRAHEAGLALTQRGSARRSLLRMGVDVEMGVHSSTFEEEMAKMDEEDIKQIEKVQQLRDRSSGSLIQPPGNASAFSISSLKQLYASKQLSFNRPSSSYSRYDSFLSTGEEIAVSNSLLATSDSKDADDSRNDKKDQCNNIFRPSHKDRLNNLLINAGLKNRSDDDQVFIRDTSHTRHMSSMSINSIDYLMNGGGPSFCEEVVFRDDTISEELDKSKFPYLRHGEKMDENASVLKEEDEELELSPAKSDVGELPSKPPTHQRSSTQGIIRSSSMLSPKRRQYNRSVSWSQAVIAKEDSSGTGGARNDSSSSNVSIISFPNLRRTAPLRSNSIASMNSMLSFPSIHMARPLRSDSIGSLLSTSSLSHGRSLHSRQTSLSSLISATSSLRPAHAIRSESQSSVMSRFPSLELSQAIRSESSAINQNDTTSWEDSDLDESDRATWESPTTAKKGQTHHVLLREASKNLYEGEGIEVENEPSVESIEKARKYRSLLTQSDYSRQSFRSRQSSNLPIKSLDDSFIVRSIDFNRHSSEILRSLSNEDLYTSHNVQTINGDSKNYEVNSLVCNNNIDDLDDDQSIWDDAPNAWNVLCDEYSLGYGAFDTLPFQILGTSANDSSCHPHVLSPPLMESLSNFLPLGLSEQNYWLKYSMVRDGASLISLLKHIRGAKNTLLAIETVGGEVLGSFTSSPWRKNWNYYGNGNSFLWRMRRTRSEKDLQHSIIDQAKLESELDVFYWSGSNYLVQYCTTDMIAMGGGDLSDNSVVFSSDEERDFPEKNPAFSNTAHGGFGLAIDSDLIKATSSSCATFQNPPLSKIHSDGTPFEILNLEVWTLTPFHDVESAQNMEMRSLFLDSYSAD